MTSALRPAQPPDIGTLAGFVEELYEQDHIPYDAAVVQAALGALIADATLGRVWVIEDAGEAAGYVVLTFGYSLEYGGRDAFVDELVVTEHCRGRGLGTAALEFVTAACPDLGVRALHLEVDRANTSAQRLYRRIGFEDHERYLMTKPVPR